jgi:DNA-binding beta-propeller fold protein YncE
LLASAAIARADDHGYANRRPSAIFTISNEADANRVLAFSIGSNGSLEEAGSYSTGGKGTGDSLGSQGALVLTEDRHFLIAVNAGSNELSVFAVDGVRLTLLSRVASGGMRPVSVTVKCGLVYVVNAGGVNNVAGFTLDARGKLSPIRGSQRALSASAAGPGQIELSPDARTLVVTEKTSNVISTFRVSAYGGLEGPTVTASAGMTPFGFEFTGRGVLVVSEAATGSMSSYRVDRARVEVISSAVADTQMAPCWVAITADDRFAYTANAGSASISSYELNGRGELTLKSARAAEFGEKGTPLDLAFARGGRFLFALDRGNTQIAGFALQRDGSLQPTAAAGKLPAFTSGLAAY